MNAAVSIPQVKPAVKGAVALPAADDYNEVVSRANALMRIEIEGYEAPIPSDRNIIFQKSKKTDTPDTPQTPSSGLVPFKIVDAPSSSLLWPFYGIWARRGTFTASGLVVTSDPPILVAKPPSLYTPPNSDPGWSYNSFPGFVRPFITYKGVVVLPSREDHSQVRRGAQSFAATATDAAYTAIWIEEVTPHYEVNDIIWCFDAGNTVVVDPVAGGAQWVDANVDARRWMIPVGHLPICDGGSLKRSSSYAAEPLLPT